MKIFWSWQSDTHQESGRYFVRDVLYSLAGELNGAPDAEEADRPTDDDERAISVDHDTLNVGGSPEIARTILGKIRECAVFVADVTPVAFTKGGKALPNPNVMIELGYALHALGHERIVLVMNLAEKAELKKLPFDLKHWRAPVSYRVGKDTLPADREEQATNLRGALRGRIEPGLKRAALMMREAARRTDRSPEFVVSHVEADPEPLVISQALRPDNTPSLAEIKETTPLLDVPAVSARDNAVLSSGFAARLAQRANRPVSEWSQDEVVTYNRRVEAYRRDYEAYLKRHEAWRRLVLRTFKIELQLENNGTAPGTLIDLDLEFPPGLILYDGDGDDALIKPTAPSPPDKRPISSTVGIIRPVAPNLGLSNLRPGGQPATRFYPEERRVSFSLDELKHHHLARPDEIWVSFETEAAIGSFEIDYHVTAREPLEPAQGTVRFEIIRQD